MEAVVWSPWRREGGHLPQADMPKAALLGTHLFMGDSKFCGRPCFKPVLRQTLTEHLAGFIAKHLAATEMLAGL
jgi:hypothetical protein